MQKLRRLFSVVLAFFISFCVCGGQFASASSEIIPFALPIDTAKVYVAQDLKYGVSSSSYKTLTAGWYNSPGQYGDNLLLGQYTVSASDDYYFSASKSFYIQLSYDCDEYYMDSDKIDLILDSGYVMLYVDGGGSAPIYLIPDSYVFTINDSFIGQDIDYKFGDQISISYDLTEENSTVYRYGIRFNFSAATKSGTGSNSSTRRLWLDTSDVNLTCNVHVTEQGLFSGLFEWLGQIKDGITDLGSSIASGFTNVVNAVTSLPGLIVDGIKNLFIPSEDDLTALQTKYEDMLEQKLGFIWQAGTVLTDFANTIISGFSGGGEYAFEFPGISVSLPSGSYTIVEAQSVSMDNAFFDVVRPVAGTGVSIIAVIGFVRIAEHMLTAIVSGASYFEFLTKKEE